MQYRFGDNVLDLDTVELRRTGTPVELEPRSFAVLRHLIEQHHRVVPKEELLDVVWGDQFVSESALTSQIKHCRRAVGDDGNRQAVIKTVHRVGYRFVAELSEPALDDPSKPPRPAVEMSPTWTPSRRETMVGRDDELVELAERLVDHQVVTVTGPGGIGKTRLCSSFLAIDRVPDGVDRWLCDLTATRDTDAVADVVLAAVGEGRQSDADPTSTLLRVVEDRAALLVLDNCEHLLAAVKSLVGLLAAAAPALRILATSRVPLGVPDESVIVLAPLTPTDAVTCFAARATDAGAHVDSGDPAVAELCERLDHMPLAIELAAARARLLSPRQMIELLDDRFRLLRSSEPHPDAGLHDSLHETIRWSWDLLGESDQRLLATLSVFVGSFSLEDAAGVAVPGGDTLDVVDGLDRLVRASMVVAVPVSHGAHRFRLLESIRDFAAEQTADPTDLQRRHSHHFADLVERLDIELLTDHVDEPMGAMANAWPNIRAAVEHASDADDCETIRRIIRAIGAYADLHQSYEVIEWCERARLVHADDHFVDDDSALVADAAAVWARLLAHRGEHERASRVAAAAHEHHPSFVTQLSLVWTAYYQGDLDQVIAGSDRLLELARSGRGLDQAYADGFAAIVAAVRQEPVLDHTDVEPSDADDGLLGALRCMSAGFRLCAADPERAALLLEAVVDSSLRNDYRLLLGASASTLTQITLPGRPPHEAMRTLCRTLGRYRERNMWPLISADTVMAANLLADAGDDEVACRLLGARNASGYRVGLSEVMRGMLHERLEAQLGNRFEQLVTEGASWSPPRAGDEAIAAMERHLEPHE